ncbi:MAG: ankyrin repeat domain-containing protein [Cytophagaceae bacterium]|nr:ankyrin repeat domain-containing protein [Gemmatimonadaceae bacterium]
MSWSSPSPRDEEFARAMHVRDHARAGGLLAQGADVNGVLRRTETFDRDVVEDTSTVLLNTSWAGDVAGVRFLLAHGADPNHAGEYSGRTALTVAVCSDHAEVVDVLLQHGADVNWIERYNKLSAMDYALEAVNPRMVRSLLAAGAEVRLRRLNFSIEGGASAREIVTMLVTHGIDINSIDDWGRTPLMWAAEHAEVDTVRLMIELGADVNRVSEDNMNGVNSRHTPLGLALAANRADIGSLLKQHGATNVGGYSTLGSLFDRIRDVFS